MDAFQIFFGLAAPKEDGSDGLDKTPETAQRTSNIVSFFLYGCIPGALIIAFIAGTCHVAFWA